MSKSCGFVEAQMEIIEYLNLEERDLTRKREGSREKGRERKRGRMRSRDRTSSLYIE